MTSISWLRPDSPVDSFPSVECALPEPDGLLAAGGDLSEERLLTAYRQGIFPWYEEGQPVLWWSPNPRTIIEPQNLHRSRSLVKRMRRSNRYYSINAEFEQIVDGCAAPRTDYGSTWITAEMKTAFCALHRGGWAHSVEVWEDDALVGGLYGLAIDRVFFGESMFSHHSDASKMALVALMARMQRLGMTLLDCQVLSAHLVSLGAITIPRRAFTARLRTDCADLVRVPELSVSRRPVLQLIG